MHLLLQIDLMFQLVAVRDHIYYEEEEFHPSASLISALATRL